MLNLLVRPIMFISALIAAVFVARDAPNFGVIQMLIGLFLIVVLVAIGAFWETLTDRWRSKTKSGDPL